MNKLKSFFEKKKLESKFKQAGAGHSLTESNNKASALQTSKGNSSQGQRQEQTSSAARAGEAALAR